VPGFIHGPADGLNTPVAADRLTTHPGLLPTTPLAALHAAAKPATAGQPNVLRLIAPAR
jgi:hypothetical protein